MEVRPWKKKRISTFVFVYCWICRQHKTFLFECELWPQLSSFEDSFREAPQDSINLLLNYAMRFDKSLFVLNDRVRTLMCWCPCNTPDEWQYLNYLMRKYYIHE